MPPQLEKNASQWLSEQKRVAAADNVDDVPQTTAWRTKKREEAIAQGLPQKRPKIRKPLTCSLCQQPKTKDYGHSRYGTVANPFAAVMRARLWNFG